MYDVEYSIRKFLCVCEWGIVRANDILTQLIMLTSLQFVIFEHMAAWNLGKWDGREAIFCRLCTYIIVGDYTCCFRSELKNYQPIFACLFAKYRTLLPKNQSHFKQNS